MGLVDDYHDCELLRQGEMRLKERAIERNICLTVEEAMGLLDIVMTCPGELTPDQRAAMLKLSDFCRQCLREGVEASPSRPLTGLPSCRAPYAA
jgi:hypothetical protein